MGRSLTLGAVNTGWAALVEDWTATYLGGPQPVSRQWMATLQPIKVGRSLTLSAVNSGWAALVNLKTTPFFRASRKCAKILILPLKIPKNSSRLARRGLYEK